jgi:hypothetical protein
MVLISKGIQVAEMQRRRSPKIFREPIAIGQDINRTNVEDIAFASHTVAGQRHEKRKSASMFVPVAAP